MSNDISDVPDSEDLATKSLRRLRKAELQHERMKERLKYFPLFEDVEYKDYKDEIRKVPKAKSRAKDSPVLQMMLARRDRYESCVKQIKRLEELLDKGNDPDLVKQIVALEAIADRHAKGIETALATFSKNDSSVQAQRAKLLTSAATLAQSDRHHADKMELQRRQNPGDIPDAELLRIANGEAPAEDAQP